MQHTVLSWEDQPLMSPPLDAAMQKTYGTICRWLTAPSGAVMARSKAMALCLCGGCELLAGSRLSVAYTASQRALMKGVTCCSAHAGCRRMRAGHVQRTQQLSTL